MKKAGDTPGELIIMMLAPAEGKEQLRVEFDQMVHLFIDGIKNASDWKTQLDSYDYILHELQGEEFSGYYAKFTMPGDLVQGMFLVMSGEHVWSVTYTGAASNWQEAVDIVKGFKRNL